MKIDRRRIMLVLWSFLITGLVLFLLFSYLLNSQLFQALPWLNEWGSFLGGLIGAAATIVAIFITIQFNKNSLNKQMEENKNIMLKQLQLQYKPVLTSDAIIDKLCLDPRDTIIRRMKITDNVMINNGWRKKNSNNQLIREVQGCYSVFKLRNIGHGLAFNIKITLEQLKEIKGLTDLNRIPETTISSFYSKCSTKKYIRTEGSQQMQDEWVLYPYFSLRSGDYLNFVFNYDECQDDIHSLIIIEYEDAYENKYKQEIYIGYIKNKPYLYPISKPVRIDKSKITT